MSKTVKITLGAVVAAIVAAVAFALITVATSPDRPLSTLAKSAIELQNPASKYAQNRTPDYIGFASAYGGVVGAADYVIAANLSSSRELGNAICTQLRNGLAESELAMRLTASSGAAYPISGSGGTRIVDSAHLLICSGTH